MKSTDSERETGGEAREVVEGLRSEFRSGLTRSAAAATASTRSVIIAVLERSTRFDRSGKIREDGLGVRICISYLTNRH